MSRKCAATPSFPKTWNQWGKLFNPSNEVPIVGDPSQKNKFFHKNFKGQFDGGHVNHGHFSTGDTKRNE